MIKSTFNKNTKGNVFAMLFAAVAMTGVLGVVGMQTVSGPVTTITKVTQRNIAETDLLTNAKIVVLNGAIIGDPDSDNYVEPAAMRTDATCNNNPTNGGCLPTNIGTVQTDPWGTPYGYCVWDHGNTTGAAGMLEGIADTSEPVIAIMSAGPDKQFQTSCQNVTAPGVGGVIEVAGSDDMVRIETYSAAVAGAGGLWAIKTGDPTTAVIDKTLEIGDVTGGNGFTFDTASNQGQLPFLRVDTIVPRGAGAVSIDDAQLQAANESLIANGACVAGTVGTLRWQTGGGGSLQVCDGSGFIDVSTAGIEPYRIIDESHGSDTYITVAGASNTDTNTVSVFTNGSERINVSSTGVVNITGDADVGGTFDVTGAATFGGNVDLGDGTDDVTTVAGDVIVDTDKLVVDVSTGFVGINEATPTSALDVTGSGDISAALTVGTNLTVNGDTTLGDDLADTLTVGGDVAVATDVFVIDATQGFIGINEAVPTSALDVTGSGAFSGSVSAASVSTTGAISAGGNLSAGGTITSGSYVLLEEFANGGACSGHEGAIQYNEGTNLVQYCNGTTWNNIDTILDLSTANLGDLGDVSIPSTPTSGQSLIWNGSAWVAGTSGTATVADEASQIIDGDSNNDDTWVRTAADGGTDNDTIRMATDGVLRLSIDPTGNVLINANDGSYDFSTIYQLQHNGTTLTEVLENGRQNWFIKGAGIATPAGRIAFNTPSGNTAIEISDHDGADYHNHFRIVNEGTYTAFHHSADTIQNGITFEPGGNIGIGTNNPAHRLDIVAGVTGGNYLMNIQNTVSSGEFLQMTATDGNPSVQFRQNGDGAAFMMLMDGDGNITTQVTHNSIYLGSGTQDASSIVQLDSTTQGFLAPRMTTAQRDAIDADTGTTGEQVAEGLMIFNTDTNTLQVNVGTFAAPVWADVGAGAAGGDADSAYQLADRPQAPETTPDTLVEVDTAGDGTANTIVFTNDNVESARFDNTGNLGIGTAIPQATLDVSDLQFDVGGPLPGDCSGISANHIAGDFDGEGDDADCRLVGLVVDNATGRVGIGTSSPNNNLQILNTSDIANIIISGAGNVNHYTSFTLQEIATADSKFWSHIFTKTNDAYIIEHFDGTAYNNYFTILGGGNVGIGIADPQATLDVAGTGAILFPRGDGTNRPSTPVEGMMRYNEATGRFEAFQDEANDDTPEWLEILTSEALNSTEAESALRLADRIEGADTAPDTMIEVDTAGDGSANTIVFTNDGTERLMIDNAGRIIIDNPSFTDPTDTWTTPGFVFSKETGQDQDIYLMSQFDSATAKIDLNFMKSRGTKAARTAVQDGDWLGELRWSGYDGDEFYGRTASIAAIVSGAVSDNDVPTDLTFRTGSVSITERMRITSAGRVGIGTGATIAPSALLELESTTRGFLPPRMANPENDITGEVAGLIAYDSDDNELQYFDGTNWVTVSGIGGSGGSFTDRIQDTGDANTYIDVDTDNADSNNTVSVFSAGTEAILVDVPNEILRLDNDSNASSFVQLESFFTHPVLNISTAANSSIGSRLLLENTFPTDPTNGGHQLNTGGSIIAAAANTAGSTNLARIQMRRSANGATIEDMEGYIAFDTNNDGGNVLAEVMRITGDQEVLVGTTTADGSAILEISSSDRGFLPPRIADPANDVVTPTAAGLIAYDSDDNELQYFDGTNWVTVSGTGGAGAIGALDDLSDVFHDTTTNFDGTGGNEDDNLFIGHEAASLTDAAVTDKGARNLAIGATAGDALTEGDDNILMGVNAGGQLTTQSSNIMMGNNAGSQITGSALWSVIIGNSAMPNVNNTAAINSVIIGQEAGRNATTTFDNVSMGYRVGLSRAGVLIGSNAGGNINDSNAARFNLMIGQNSGNTLTNGDNNLLLGYGTDVTSATSSNELNIGEAIFGVLPSRANDGTLDGVNAATAGAIGIGVADATAIDASAILELESDNRGFLAPRMSSTDRGNISSPAEGLLVYDTTENNFYVYDGGWTAVGGDATAAGSDTQIQYNMGDALMASADFTFNDTSNVLDVNGTVDVSEGVILGSITGAAVPAYPTLTADNLGNHTATQTLVMGSNIINNDGDANEGLTFDANGRGVFASTSGGISSILTLVNNSTSVGSGAQIALTKGPGTLQAAIASEVGATGNQASLLFSTHNGTSITEQMRIDSDGRVGMGTGATIDASALLDLTATDKGFLPPRLANTGAVTAPAKGLIIYDQSDDSLKINIGTSGSPDWVAAGGGVTGAEGADTQIQFNVGNELAASPDLTFNDTSDVFSVNGIVSASSKINIGSTTGAAAPSYPTLTASSVWTQNGDDIYYDQGTYQVGIGTATPDVALDVAGDIEYTGTLTDLSDMRLKTDIKPFSTDEMIEKIAAIDTYSFKMIDGDGATEFGVMAQELEKIFPELVRTADDEMGTKSVNYVGLIAPMIAATQDLKAENDNLRAEIETLKAQQQQMLQDVRGLKAQTGYGTQPAAFTWPMMVLMMVFGGGMLYVMRRHPKSN